MVVLSRICHPSHIRILIIRPTLAPSIRNLSSKDIFFRSIPDKLVSQVPSAPSIPLPSPPLEELVATGHSVLEELELWSWWKPSAWIRWGLELVHFHTGLPWWSTIAICTALIRIGLIYFPVKIQKYTAKQQQHMPEILKFQKKMQEARLEGDALKMQEYMYEQQQFFKKLGFSPYKMMPLMGVNGFIFMSQFFAIRNMAKEKYPGFSTEGTLWFTNLSHADPYWLLPLLSATTMHITFRSGSEMGSMDMYGPAMKNMMLYLMPIVVFVASAQFPSALGVYWIINNVLTLIISKSLRTKTAQRILKLPEMPKKVHSSGIRDDFKTFTSQYQAWKTSGGQDERINIRKRDAEQFKYAGQGKPVFFDQNDDNEKTKNKAAWR